MSDPRNPPPDPHNWPRTTPGVLPPAVAAAAKKPAVPGTRAAAPSKPPPPQAAGGRAQPPLQEVLKGLDARELEGESVFDQLFGPLPEGDPRLPKG